MAEAVGIEITKVDPAYTSQRCSKCRTTFEENRWSQARLLSEVRLRGSRGIQRGEGNRLSAAPCGAKVSARRGDASPRPEVIIHFVCFNSTPTVMALTTAGLTLVQLFCASGATQRCETHTRVNSTQRDFSHRPFRQTIKKRSYLIWSQTIRGEWRFYTVVRNLIGKLLCLKTVMPNLFVVINIKNDYHKTLVYSTSSRVTRLYIR